MHLSLLSDGYFSDVVDDAGCRVERPNTAGRAHRDSLLRGLAFMGIAGLLIGLTLLSCPLRSAEADTRCRIPAASASNDVQAAVWWEAATPFSRSNEGLRPLLAPAQPGTAVSLMALRQRFRSACR